MIFYTEFGEVLGHLPSIVESLACCEHLPEGLLDYCVDDGGAEDPAGYPVHIQGIGDYPGYGSRPVNYQSVGQLEQGVVSVDSQLFVAGSGVGSCEGKERFH